MPGVLFHLALTNKFRIFDTLHYKTLNVYYFIVILFCKYRYSWCERYCYDKFVIIYVQFSTQEITKAFKYVFSIKLRYQKLVHSKQKSWFKKNTPGKCRPPSIQMEIKVITRTFNFILQFINLNHFQADYTIVYLTDTVAVEYDCSSFLGLFTNYCIHILSRTPTISTEDEAAAISYAESLGLNTQNLPFHKTLQTGCWWLYCGTIILDFFYWDWKYSCES